jgi:hemolysin III
LRIARTSLKKVAPSATLTVATVTVMSLADGDTPFAGALMTPPLALPKTAVRAAGYTAGEEIANVVTHALGAVLSVVGLAILVEFSARFGTAWHVATGAVFGAMLIFLYTASTLYHAVPGPRAKHVMKILDHAGIYLLIAGTYTPITLVTLRGAWGWGLFAAVWTLAVVGIALEAAWVYRPKWLSAVVFLAMGWMVMLASRQLVAALPRSGLVLLMAGGLFYSLGTVFYVMKRVPYMHAVWHVFVLGGSVCHFFAVALYVIPVLR